MGREAWKHAGLTDGYASEEGTFINGENPHAEVPFLVEALAATCEPPASIDDDDDDAVYAVDIVGFTINRSPAIGYCAVSRVGRSRDLSLTFSGMSRNVVFVPKGAFDIALNITSPYIHILGDNKTPALECFQTAIATAIAKAIARSARNNPPVLISANGQNDDHGGDERRQDSPKKQSQRDQVLSVLAGGGVIAQASGDGALSFNQRSLYYVVRELVPGSRTVISALWSPNSKMSTERLLGCSARTAALFTNRTATKCDPWAH